MLGAVGAVVVQWLQGRGSRPSQERLRGGCCVEFALQFFSLQLLTHGRARPQGGIPTNR